ncbi:nucleotidyltransferase [Xylanibacillus composti]|uniref:tRNA(Met) cytidine acetate ligase n=1 Tax=Xylanibacillus composti TaxID=1572762 RepID=A0A8J4H534_9BACL|nr:nucleotidyltransferase [Xylanibacillus composti]MDT9724138.1 nucleotidyltransferase [Xylanibacillus composti]GIQ68688.1 UPF0348 protein YlbM [Xylanibacillus composti]
MKTAGIIVEYNPLHNGHVYHYRRTKDVTGAECVVAVMSGNFLQRGEPALVNKWARAEMALEMGADLVIELPVLYASQPAEWFAYGAVSALHATGVVDVLCFGSESGDIGWLQQLASLVSSEPATLGSLIRAKLQTGIPFPAAYAAAVAEFAAQSGLVIPEGELGKPNNTLGLHYLIALHRIGSPIQPYTVTRTKADYREQTPSHESIASATAIRRLWLEQGDIEAIRPYVPGYTYAILKREQSLGRAPLDWERYYTPLLARLAVTPPVQLQALAEVSEGLEHRIRDLLFMQPPCESFEQLISGLKTKRYTRTKLQRTLLRILLNHPGSIFSREQLAAGVPYLRVLGFSEAGRRLLKRMKQTAAVPVFTRVSKSSSRQLDLDLRASYVYALGYPQCSPEEWQRDIRQAPLRQPSIQP